MQGTKKEQLKHKKSTGIILGIFLFIFAVVGACLFSPVSSPFALQGLSALEAEHMDMGTPHQDYTPLHPGGGFFAIDAVTTTIGISVLAILGSVLFFIRKKHAPPFQKGWQRLVSWAELHNPHSPYLFLFQDGIVHPKVF